MISTRSLNRLRSVRYSLGAAASMIRDLDRDGCLRAVANQEPKRWNHLLDSLSAGMESGEMGSIQQVLTALDGALEQ